jgi:OmpA-OmpF porin, OOP family
MRKHGYRLLALFMLLTIMASGAEASIKNRKFSIHLDLNGVQPALNDSAQVWLFSPYWGADFQYMLDQQTALMFSYRTGKIYNDSISTSTFKFNNDRANRRWKVTSFAIGPKFYLNQRKGTTPYFVSKLEMIMWDIKTYPGGKSIEIQDGDGVAKDYKATELAITAGFGLEQLIGDRFALSLGAEFTYLTDLGADFAQWVNNSRSKAFLQFGAGLSFHFGGKHRDLMKESEKEDQEQERISRKVYEADVTPRGDTVFVDQARTGPKSDSTILVPRKEEIPDQDEDTDGIFDLLDKCPRSPVGAVVDRDGCPLDSDNDGIFDGLDRCPHTEARDRSQVDGTGCTPDSDYDGIPDYRDNCPNSPEHAVVDSSGCIMDLDNDGVANELDLCPDTPAKTPVDQRGCADLDKIFAKRVFHKLFYSGQAELRAEGAGALDSLVTLMSQYNDVTMTVYGYTDDVGPDETNLQLTQRRADAVRAYLVKKGLDGKRVLAIGRGETNFMASNRTRNGRELNRRMEIEFKTK